MWLGLPLVLVDVNIVPHVLAGLPFVSNHICAMSTPTANPRTRRRCATLCTTLISCTTPFA